MVSNIVCKVSSTINKDVQHYGKHFMFDNNDETCWNSDQGRTQWIKVDFLEPITFHSIGIQFQGGFAAKAFQLEVQFDSENTYFIDVFECLDNNKLQVFPMKTPRCVQNAKLTFIEPCDTFGRIIVYHLKFIK